MAFSARMVKIMVEVPETHASALRAAMGEAGAGVIGTYRHCSFSVRGTGRFTPGADAQPAVGEVGKAEEVAEEQIQMVCERRLLNKVLSAIKKAHPYEEPGISIYPLENSPM